jgi:carboxyl-terminal processing protease
MNCPQRNPAPDITRRLRTRGALRLALALISGIVLGWVGAMGCASTSTQEERDFRLMSQAWGLIERHYVDRAAVKPEELTYGAISGMVDALGDTGHSAFLTPAMVKELKEMERGEFKGIGVEIQMKDDRVVIVAPIDDSPAQRAGLRPGEIIIKVKDQDIAGWPISRVVEQITGPAGTTVALTIEDPRTERTRQVVLRRADIKVRAVTWLRLPGTGVIHLRLATFDSGTTKELRQALTQIRRAPARGLILDLRNNPGGVLDEAIGVASQFLDHGNVMLVKDARGRTSPVPVEKGGLATQVPLTVLINAGTASAAEIVTGALKDGHRAVLVGEKTFGTGTVLTPYQLADGSALLLAIEEWLTPDGRSYWHKGIIPNLEVALPAGATPMQPAAERELTAEQLHASEDRQLLQALALLQKTDANGTAGQGE